MTPLAIEKATRLLGPPAGVDSADCGNLMIRDVPCALGNNMWSAWEPTAAELEILNTGGKVYLAIAGTQHPPVVVVAGHILLPEDAVSSS